MIIGDLCAGGCLALELNCFPLRDGNCASSKDLRQLAA